MKSMTGYGRAGAQSGGFHAVVECASVNRKQTELSLSASREFLHLEPRIREVVLRKVNRGRVQVSLEISTASASALIDRERAREYHRELSALAKHLKLEAAISLETVLSGPGVIRNAAAAGDPWPAVKKALESAMDQMIEMREVEGQHLKKTLRRELTILSATQKKVRPLAKKVPERLRTLLLERLKKSGLSMDFAEPRLVAEIAVFAERCDISEELDRLDSHVAQFLQLLESPEPVGRTLEFLSQEIGREWNTIGSKAGDAAIARFVVEAKAALDKIKEQLANIE